jgi:hypothetical protein
VNGSASEVNDGHGRVLVCVELDKGEATVCLHANLDNVAKALEERDQVGLCRVGDEIAAIDYLHVADVVSCVDEKDRKEATDPWC